MNAEAMAKYFHDTYEALAPSFGYETRPDTKQFDPQSPNGRLMIAVCQNVIERHMEGKVLVPREPSDKHMDGLARAIMLWMDMDERKTPKNLFKHLHNTGEEVPLWLSTLLFYGDENVMPKGMRCLLVYKAMIAAAQDKP